MTEGRSLEERLNRFLERYYGKKLTPSEIKQFKASWAYKRWRKYRQAHGTIVDGI